MKHKKALAIVAAGALASYNTYKTIGNDMFERLFKRRNRENDVDQKYLDWIASSQALQVKVKSFDGLKLDAYNIRNHENGPYMIMVHGIRADRSQLYSRAYAFDKRGYNILLVDQRASGDSEGDHYTYGLKESQDLQIWISYLTKKYPDSKICLYGLLSGASTVMMGTAYELSKNVSCIVEENGYPSLEEEFAYLIRKDYKLAVPQPVNKLLEGKMKTKFGMTYADVSAKSCLEKNEVPILFIQNNIIDLVSQDSAKILYNHNKGMKKYYSVDADNDVLENEESNYYKNIDSFIRSCMD